MSNIDLGNSGGNAPTLSEQQIIRQALQLEPATDGFFLCRKTPDGIVWQPFDFSLTPTSKIELTASENTGYIMLDTTSGYFKSVVVTPALEVATTENGSIFSCDSAGAPWGKITSVSITQVLGGTFDFSSLAEDTAIQPINIDFYYCGSTTVILDGITIGSADLTNFSQISALSGAGTVINSSLNLRDLGLDYLSLNILFTELGAGSGTIDITGTLGAATCDPSIAEAKGYTVVTGIV